MAMTPGEMPITPGSQYSKAPGGFDIAKKIADFLEDFYPDDHPGANRARTVSWANNLLHGRSSTYDSDSFLDTLEELDAPGSEKRLADIRAMVQLFEQQKALIPTVYGGPVGIAYQHRYDDVCGREMKIITQADYDRAVRISIPADFFINAFVHGIDIYCLPENTSFEGARLTECKFNVCAARGALFRDTTINSCDFQTVDMRYSHFDGCTLAHTHFNDANISNVHFDACRIANGSFTNCKMHLTGFNLADLKEVRFDRTHDARMHTWNRVSVSFGAVESHTKEHLKLNMARELGLPVQHISGAKRPKPPPGRSNQRGNVER